MSKYQKMSLGLFILIYLIVIGDIILEVCYKMFFTPFLLGDNIGIFVMTIIFIIFIIKKSSKLIEHLLAAASIILIAGFIVKGIGIFYFKKKEQPLLLRWLVVFFFLEKYLPSLDWK